MIIVHLKSDWLTVCESNNSESVLQRITFPSVGDALFYIFDTHGIGVGHFSKSAGFGMFPCLPMNPETDFSETIFFISKKFLCMVFLRIYLIVYFPNLTFFWKYFWLLIFGFYSHWYLFCRRHGVSAIFVFGCYRFVSVSFGRIRVVHFEIALV